MPRLRVFVSSTCYDLQILRSELRPFIVGMGYEPVMSDYSDLLYDPRSHTHESCLKEVPGCDVVLLIIGSRFGGEAVPSAFDHIDFNKLSSESINFEVLGNNGGLSITQLEVLKAVEQGLPVYAFVDQSVYNDHHLYERNKHNKDVIDKIDFPSIQKKDTAIYIFEFINFLRKRGRNNSLQEFSRLDDIKNHLTSQWSQLFQKLLFESKTKAKEERRYRDFSERIEELKAVVLASIATPDLMKTAKGAIQYRRLIDFLTALSLSTDFISTSTVTWTNTLSTVGITKISLIPDITLPGLYRSVMIFSDSTFAICRFSPEMITQLSVDWAQFILLEHSVRQAIANALLENTARGPIHLIKRYNIPYDQYVSERKAKEDKEEEDPTADVPF